MIDWFVCDKTNHNKAVIVSLIWGCGPHLTVEVESFFLYRPTLPLSLEVEERLKSQDFDWYNEATNRQSEANAGWLQGASAHAPS